MSAPHRSLAAWWAEAGALQRAARHLTGEELPASSLWTIDDAFAPLLAPLPEALTAPPGIADALAGALPGSADLSDFEPADVTEFEPPARSTEGRGSAILGPPRSAAGGRVADGTTANAAPSAAPALADRQPRVTTTDREGRQRLSQILHRAETRADADRSIPEPRPNTTAATMVATRQPATASAPEPRKAHPRLSPRRTVEASAPQPPVAARPGPATATTRWLKRLGQQAAGATTPVSTASESKTKKNSAEKSSAEKNSPKSVAASSPVEAVLSRVGEALRERRSARLTEPALPAADGSRERLAVAPGASRDASRSLSPPEASRGSAQRPTAPPAAPATGNPLAESPAAMMPIDRPPTPTSAAVPATRSAARLQTALDKLTEGARRARDTRVAKPDAENKLTEGAQRARDARVAKPDAEKWATAPSGQETLAATVADSESTSSAADYRSATKRLAAAHGLTGLRRLAALAEPTADADTAADETAAGGDSVEPSGAALPGNERLQQAELKRRLEQILQREASRHGIDLAETGR